MGVTFASCPCEIVLEQGVISWLSGQSAQLQTHQTNTPPSSHPASFPYCSGSGRHPLSPPLVFLPPPPHSRRGRKKGERKKILRTEQQPALNRGRETADGPPSSGHASVHQPDTWEVAEPLRGLRCFRAEREADAGILRGRAADGFVLERPVSVSVRPACGACSVTRRRPSR